MSKRKVMKIASVADFYTAHERWILLAFTLLLIFIPLFLSFHFRSYTADLPVTKDWATSNVYNAVRSNIDAQVQKQYPNLPVANRKQLVDQQFNQMLQANKEQVDQQIASVAASFKAQMQDPTGQTYLLAIDPYQFLRLSENYLNHGYVGDRLVNGKPYDDHMYAPIGAWSKLTLHPWLAVQFHRFLSLFGERSVMSSFFWLPVVLSMLAVIPAFFFGRRRGGLIAGFFTAMIIAVHSGFIGRTAAGFSDTDAYTILFPLLCGWLLLEAFETEWRDWKRWGVFMVLTGFMFGLFSWVWEWWFFFDVFVMVLIAYVLFFIVKRLVNGASLKALLSEKKLKAWGVTFVGFIISTGVFVSLFISFQKFLSGPFSAAIGRIEGTKAAVNFGTLWPNVQTTVAELNVPSISGIISSIGGKFLFIIALLGVLATLLPKKGRLLLKDWVLLAVGLVVSFYLVGKGASMGIYAFLVIMAVPIAIGFIFLVKDDRDIDVKYALFLYIWLTASVFAMTKGLRFVLLLIPPFAISAGIAIGTAYRLLKEWLTDNLKFSVLWVAPVLFILLSILLIPPVVQGHRTGLQESPSMSDAWWDTLTKIKQESAPDAIINSWWDFGHWFKYVADRAVTFDGGSQNVPHAHWIGRVLITPDEKEALAILRMVDCGNYLGVEDVKAGLPSHDDYESIALTKKIIMMPPDKAKQQLLAAGISAQQAEVVLNHTHCEPPEDYFITSADMVGKGGVWGHFGSWDFARADAYQNLRHLPQATAVSRMVEKYNWTESDAQSRYFEMQALPSQEAVNSWISPWPSYPAGSFSACSYAENGTLVVCDMRIGVGQNQGAQTVIDRLVVDMEGMNRTHLEIGFYDQSGRKVGENDKVLPAEIVIASEDGFGKYQLAGAGFNQAFLLDLRSTPKVLMLDPKNAESMFTRLFFLEGKGTVAFEKFSDQNAFNLGRIIVWKVNWTKLEEFGLV